MMKVLTRLLPCLLVWLCLAACRPKPYPSLLLAADSLISVLPDSACSLLASFAPDTVHQPQYIRMYHRLLCVKANDKAYIPHTSDSVILPVVDYYQDKGDEKRLPEVYYYAGRVYRDLGNVLQAMDYFEDALDDIHKQDARHHPLKVKVYSQLGTLYAYQRMYKEAFDMYTECLLMHKASGDSVGMVFSLRDVGNMCRELHYSDKALRCYKEAKNIADGLGRIDLSRMLQSQLVGTYTDVQLYDSARLALQEVLHHIERPSQSAVYSTAAYYYQAVGKKDSANFYYRKLLKCGTVYAKNKAYRSLFSDCVENGLAIHSFQRFLMECWNAWTLCKQ